jgi:hypothetical protein
MMTPGRSAATIRLDHSPDDLGALMPEGLSPIEVGKQVHEHTKEPHEPDGGSRHSRTVQIGEALLLSWPTRRSSR